MYINFFFTFHPFLLSSISFIHQLPSANANAQERHTKRKFPNNGKWNIISSNAKESHQKSTPKKTKNGWKEGKKFNDIFIQGIWHQSTIIKKGRMERWKEGRKKKLWKWKIFFSVEKRNVAAIDTSKTQRREGEKRESEWEMIKWRYAEKKERKIVSRRSSSSSSSRENEKEREKSSPYFDWCEAVNCVNFYIYLILFWKIFCVISKNRIALRREQKRYRMERRISFFFGGMDWMDCWVGREVALIESRMLCAKGEWEELKKRRRRISLRISANG